MTSRPWHASRASAERGALARFALLAVTLALASLSSPAARAAGGEPASCRNVRMADVGWSDVTATTAVASQVLQGLGYRPQTTLLSVPVAFASMRAGDIDLFLGNWMPAQVNDRRPYLEDGSVEEVRTNLLGAKYTLAVPKYAFDAGLRDFADIQRFAEPLGRTIYGIESGNIGNHHVLDMIGHDGFGLGAFHLVESSEQGMLAEVARAYAERRPIVFLAWDPHPMNLRFELRYLTGGDAFFGPNFGGATVHTLVRRGLLAECPNVARLLRNLEFTPAAESEIMLSMTDGHLTPEAAAAKWLAGHTPTWSAWLAGVTTFDGRVPRTERVVSERAGLGAAFERQLTAHKIPVGEAIAQAIDWIKGRGATVFRAISATANGTVGGANRLLGAVPAGMLIAGFALLAWGLQRSWGLALFVAAALLFILNQGYWRETLETLSLVLIAASVAMLIGVPVGIATARRPRLHAALRPVLDLMQTLPTFVYLIPTLVLFGLGVVPALISTVIFALPAPIRLTHLGITGVPRSLIEAGEAFGATRWQLLYKVELPSAAPLIIAGITQGIMLSLSMVVIAALVGAGGLGVPVVRALNTVQVGMGFEAGLAIVLVAIVLDRITRLERDDASR